MRAGSTRSTVTGTTLSFTHTWLMATFSPTIAFSAMIGSLFGSDPVARAMVVHANAPQASNGPAEHRIQVLAARSPSVQLGRTQTSVDGTPNGVHEDLTLSDLAALANPGNRTPAVRRPPSATFRHTMNDQCAGPTLGS